MYTMDALQESFLPYLYHNESVITKYFTTLIFNKMLLYDMNKLFKYDRSLICGLFYQLKLNNYFQKMRMTVIDTN